MQALRRSIPITYAESEYIMIVTRKAEDETTAWHATIGHNMLKNLPVTASTSVSVLLSGRNDVRLRVASSERLWNLQFPIHLPLPASRCQLIPVIPRRIRTRTLPWGQSVGGFDVVHESDNWIICKRRDIVSRAVQTFWRGQGSGITCCASSSVCRGSI